MKQREYYRFAADVRRLRPLASVIVTVLVMTPSFVEMGTESLSASERARASCGVARPRLGVRVARLRTRPSLRQNPVEKLLRGRRTSLIQRFSPQFSPGAGRYLVW